MRCKEQPSCIPSGRAVCGRHRRSDQGQAVAITAERGWPAGTLGPGCDEEQTVARAAREREC
jgi:hypothetical protein